MTRSSGTGIGSVWRRPVSIQISVEKVWLRLSWTFWKKPGHSRLPRSPRWCSVSAINGQTLAASSTSLHVCLWGVYGRSTTGDFFWNQIQADPLPKFALLRRGTELSRRRASRLPRAGKLHDVKKPHRETSTAVMAFGYGFWAIRFTLVVSAVAAGFCG